MSAGSLRKEAISQGRFLYMREGIGIVVRAGGMVLLTRLIGPTQYGLFAGPALINIFMVTVVTTGMDTVLIRRPGLKDDWFHFVFTYLLLTSVSVGALGVAVSGWMGTLEGDSRMAGPFAVLAAALPLNVLWVPGRALLERALNYRKLAWVELSSDVGQYAVSLSAAFIYRNVWAAVWGYLARQFILIVGVYLVSGYRPRLHWDRALLREGLRFGSGFSGGQLAQRAGDMVVPIVVGRYLGARDVGIAALTVRLAETLSFVNRATYRIGVVALGRVQGDVKRLRRAVEDFMAMQVLATGPMLTGFALSAWVVVPLFLGDRWTRVITLFPFIAINYLINTQFTGQVAALAARGRSGIIMRNSVVNTAVLFGACFLLVSHFGLTGYAVAETVALGANYLTHIEIKRILGGGVSYRRTIPWLLVLIPPLFAPATPAWAAIICVSIPVLTFLVPRFRAELLRSLRMVTEGLQLRGRFGKKGAGRPQQPASQYPVGAQVASGQSQSASPGPVPATDSDADSDEVART